VANVPAEYQKLIGEHADHPGEGLGRGAQSRQSDQQDFFAGAVKDKAA
jgi:hypothetical protein